MKIGVVGPSHLGLVWSAILAHKKYRAVYLKSARFECYEPNLRNLIEEGIQNNFLEYNNSYSTLGDCDIVFLAWDTPTDKYNNVQLDLLERVIAAIIPNLHPDAIFVIMSQVPPKFVRSIDFPKERLFHQVDTLIFGNSLERAMKPEVMIIGNFDGNSLIPENYYDLLMSFNCPKVFITYEEAEIFKLAMNANLAAQIGVTNTLAELCNHVGAEWECVEAALRYDSRIGTYTKPGLGIGGGHMERDLNTIEMLSRKHGFHSDIIGASISSSRYMQYWALRKVREYLPEDKPYEIAVWGLSYKENTDSIKDSAAIATIDALPHCKFLVHDPKVSLRRDNLLTVGNPLEAIDEETDALLIMTPHDEYKKIKQVDIVDSLSARKLIIDPYSILGPAFKKMSYTYCTLG
jgi:UDPglucose 6-dehydrogenase